MNGRRDRVYCFGRSCAEVELQLASIVVAWQMEFVSPLRLYVGIYVIMDGSTRIGEGVEYVHILCA